MCRNPNGNLACVRNPFPSQSSLLHNLPPLLSTTDLNFRSATRHAPRPTCHMPQAMPGPETSRALVEFPVYLLFSSNRLTETIYRYYNSSRVCISAARFRDLPGRQEGDKGEIRCRDGTVLVRVPGVLSISLALRNTCTGPPLSCCTADVYMHFVNTK